MRKVYIINKGGHDYTEAKSFGELVICSEGLISKYNTSQMCRQFQASMADSDEHDLILLTSLSTMCSIAAAYFSHKHGRLNLLIYKDGKYVERTVVFNGS